MEHAASIAGTPEETITCRVFDPAQGLWLTASGSWGSEAEALHTPLAPAGLTRHYGQVTVPSHGVVVEYLLEGEPIGEEVVQAIGTEQFVIPVVTGSNGKAEFTSQKRLTLTQGDSYRIPVSLGRDCLGWEAWFAGKATPGQSAYDMPLRQLQWEDPGSGTLYIDLAATDTARAGTFYAEIELRKGEETSTPERYTFRIVEDIVKR